MAASGTALVDPLQPQEASEIGGGAGSGPGSGVMLKGVGPKKTSRKAQDADGGSRS